MLRTFLMLGSKMASKFGELQVFGHVQITFKCKWKISCFSSLDSGVGQRYDSEVFKVEENDLEWFLTIYPGGIDEANKGYVSCSVCVRNLPVGKCKFRLLFINTDNEVLFDEGYNDWRTITTGRGYHETIKAETLKLRLINDTLIVIVDATYIGTTCKDGVQICDGGEVTPIMKVIDDFKNLWMSKKNTDAIISLGDGENIPVHSVVLCARSKVFAAMFEHDTVEKTTRRVVVTDFEKDTMESFMEYVYSGSVHEMNLHLALELLRASDKYDVDDLKLYCSNYLKSLLKDENVCAILLNADVYNAEKLRAYALEYFLENISKENFQSQRSVFKARPDLLSDIVEGMIEGRRIRSAKKID